MKGILHVVYEVLIKPGSIDISQKMIGYWGIHGHFDTGYFKGFY